MCQIWVKPLPPYTAAPLAQGGCTTYPGVLTWGCNKLRLRSCADPIIWSQFFKAVADKLKIQFPPPVHRPCENPWLKFIHTPPTKTTVNDPILRCRWPLWIFFRWELCPTGSTGSHNLVAIWWPFGGHGEQVLRLRHRPRRKQRAKARWIARSHRLWLCGELYSIVLLQPVSTCLITSDFSLRTGIPFGIPFGIQQCPSVHGTDILVSFGRVRSF